ncbi:MAG: hypothetical protein ACLGIO_13825 [Acidimicrobiia bacterium]
MVGGATALWGLAIGLRPLGDNSALTHLATGRLILSDGIPRSDPFSFTAAGEPWTVYSWLASTLMALAERAGGGNAIQLGRAGLTCGLAVLAWVLSRPAGVLAGRILAVAPVLVVGTSAWTERPLLFSLVIMAVVVLLAERDQAPPWLVLPVMWVWVNVHGSFPLGLVYLGARLAGRRIDRAPPGGLPRLAALAGAGALLGALNPLGAKLLVFPLELLSRNDLLSRVSEWRSPNFSRPPNLALLGMILLALLLCSRRRSFEDGLPAVVFGAAAAIAVRNAPLATIVLLPVLARGLSGLGTVRGEGRSGLTATGAAGVAAVGAVLVVTALQQPAYDLGKYPVRQVRWMEEQGLFERRVATEDFVGNYLIAEQGADAEVFFDDRFDMYPPPVIRDSIALLDGREGWQERLDRYGVDVVLWQRSRPLAGLLALDPGWEVVRRDKGWLVAVRRP